MRKQHEASLKIPDPTVGSCPFRPCFGWGGQGSILPARIFASQVLTFGGRKLVKTSEFDRIGVLRAWAV